MSRVIGAFAPENASNSAIIADAAHTLAKSALNIESACVAEVLRQFGRRGGPRADGAIATAGTVTDDRALSLSIVRLFAPTPAHTASPDNCAYTDVLTCADSLALATGRDVTLANAVLDRLERGLDLTGPATAHDAQASAASVNETHAIERAAWRTAQLMSHTTSGYEALRRVAGATWPQAEGVRHAPRVWLRAGDALVRTGSAAAGPASIFRLARQWHGDPTADPTQRHVAAMALAAAKLWRGGEVSALTPAEIGVVFAGRHNYMTDGPGTPFAKVKSRLFKTIDTSIPRASDSRWKTALPRVIGKQKTAFAILDKGIRSAHLDLIEKERAALRTSVDNALASLAAQMGADGSEADATRSLAAIVARMSQTGGDAASVLLERAELACWTTRPARAYGDALDIEDYRTISSTARAAFARLPIPSASSSRRV